jgi:hypothetical protein
VCPPQNLGCTCATLAVRPSFTCIALKKFGCDRGGWPVGAGGHAQQGPRRRRPAGGQGERGRRRGGRRVGVERGGSGGVGRRRGRHGGPRCACRARQDLSHPLPSAITGGVRRRIESRKRRRTARGKVLPHVFYFLSF